LKDKLAYQFYGDQTFWPVIAVSNNIGKGTIIVKSGTILRIPDPDVAKQFINTINSSR
jgi:nucleoid-associated protein YgaU